MNKSILAIILLFLTSGAFAAEKDPAKQKAVKKKKPVEDAPKVEPGYVPQEDITIIESKDTLIKEYRIEGQLRAVKITPKNGMPPYYLVDSDGTGEFVRMGPDMGEEVKVPQWILFEW